MLKNFRENIGTAQLETATSPEHRCQYRKIVNSRELQCIHQKIRGSIFCHKHYIKYKGGTSLPNTTIVRNARTIARNTTRVNNRYVNLISKDGWARDQRRIIMLVDLKGLTEKKLL